jgi:hypothetical protein
MQYIECPSEEEPKNISIFLAGGITNCPDWQSEVVERLKDRNITIFNPRRKNFPINDPSASLAQILWEYKRLRSSTLNLFWFSRGSVNPIALFELGSALERPTHVLIGCDPGYERISDVEIQTRLRCPQEKVAHSLKELLEDLSILIGFFKLTEEVKKLQAQ